MDAFAGQRIQIDGQGGDQGLAFAGLHLGDVAVVQDHAADQLHVEMALAEGALGRFADHRKGFRQQVFEGLALASRSRKAGVMAPARRPSWPRSGSRALILETRAQNGLDFALVGRTEKSLSYAAETQHEIL